MAQIERSSTENEGRVQEIAQSQRPTAIPIVELPERPSLAPNVELVGEMPDTGYTDQQWIIQRDGTFLQVPEILYRVAEHTNGERTLEEIAAAITHSTDWHVTGDNVRQIMQSKLIPLGLVTTADGGVVPRIANQERSALQIRMRKKVIGPEVVGRIARVLQVVFAPVLLIPILVIIVVAHIWLYFVHGVADGLRAALYTPGGLLLVLAFMLASGVVHELGHAAALTYGGGRARGMGVGLYLVFPTLYTDTTDAYRLGRWARLRTDLGGIYFHLIFVLGIVALYFVSGVEVLLAVAVLVTADIAYQLLPFVRLDGYWALADITGIPDFFSQMKPFLRSMSPLKQEGEKLPGLKRQAKIAFVLYIVLAIPTLAILLFLMLTRFPRFIETTWDSFHYQVRVFFTALHIGDFLVMAAVASQALLLGLAMVASIYFLYVVARKPVIMLWNWSKPTATRRLSGASVALSVVSLLGLLWAPYLPFVSGPPVPDGVQNFNVSDRLHVQGPVAYPQDPPVGGDHAGIWQSCGFYDAPIANENAVHSLEHGVVWIAYRPDLPPDQMESLRWFADSYDRVIVSPYPGLEEPVVVSAWARQLRLDTVDDPRLDQFVRAFQNGRQAPETGGPCSDGVGDPR